MSDTTKETPMEGVITIKVNDGGESYSMLAHTYSTSTTSSMLVQEYAMPQEMTEKIVRMSLEQAQHALAKEIATHIQNDINRLYGKEVKELAKEWARANKDKIVDKLLAEAKSGFISKFEDDIH